jgi:phospholipase/carboxylesterase
VFVHGYGANGDDLIGLAQSWAGLLPDVLFISPNAPEAVPGYPQGRQWFPISRLDPHLLDQGAREGAGALEGFLSAELDRWGLTPDRLVLVGFSQGTMLSLQVGLRRAVAPAAIVGFSGALPNSATLAAEAVGRPPVLLIHGDRDDVVPFQASEAAARVLEAAGYPVFFARAQGLGHGISPEGLTYAGQFIRQALDGAQPPA